MTYSNQGEGSHERRGDDSETHCHECVVWDLVGVVTCRISSYGVASIYLGSKRPRSKQELIRVRDGGSTSIGVRGGLAL